MLKAKCIDVNKKQYIIVQKNFLFRFISLSHEQWQTLIFLHKSLLHKHHDFFLTFQHSFVSSALNKLAVKYLMPTKMWRHEIHAFLKILRHRLSKLLKYMLTFIYIAYFIMTMLYEIVFIFENTWIKCLKNLNRYRMTIENEDFRDRKMWNDVIRFWYSKTADKNLNIDKLYHHLTILARPYILQQLSYYAKFLTCVTSFESVKISIIILFTSILNDKKSTYHRFLFFETSFIKIHKVLYCERSSNEFSECFHQIKKNLLKHYIEKVTTKFKKQDVFVTIVCIASLFENKNASKISKARTRSKNQFFFAIKSSVNSSRRKIDDVDCMLIAP